jgi:hypothetical protein
MPQLCALLKYKGLAEGKSRQSYSSEKVIFDLLEEVSPESFSRIVADLANRGVGLDFKNRKFYKIV